MRNKSKLLSLLLTLCLVVNMMPSMVFAEINKDSAVVIEENISSEENLDEDAIAEEEVEEESTEEDAKEEVTDENEEITEEETTEEETTEDVDTQDENVDENEEITEEENTEEESSEDIVIMHTNDVHSRVDDNLGYASVKGWKNQFESEGKDVLLLDAGDTLHGLPVANLSNGSNIVKIMNAVGYDAMTTGNHDYNYGITRLLQLKNEMNFDLLVSNVTKGGAPAFTSSKVYEKGGKKLGVVGVATPETATKTNPANVAGYSFNEDKLAQIVQGEINSLKAQGADYVIGLGHLGLDDESAPYKSTDLIKDVEGLDIFVDGHSHHNLPNGSTVQDKTGEDVVVVQTGDYAKEIGKVVIKEDGTIKASLIKEKKEDAQTAALINQMKEDIKPQLDRVVGKTDVVLDGNRAPGVRTKETNLANLVTDGLKYVSGADVALTNGGGIRTSVDAGDITYGELNAVLPFGNVVTTIEVTGEQIVQALEHGTTNVPDASGAFPQVSGITYEIHSYLSENRVKNVKINGQAVQLDKKYVLATNDFMAVGGDGYEMFKTAKKLGEFGAMDEALISYIEQLPNSTVGEEYAKEQGRITIHTTNPNEGDIVIMHTNDVHSRVDDNLGYSSVKGWKNYFESNGNDVLLLDAGDTLHGLPIANLSNGSNIVKIMNEVGYDAMTTGNHDYNYGITRLLELNKEMNFDLLVSNVTKDNENAFTSSKIYEKGDKKVGVVGVATPETATKTNPANVAGYSFNEDKLAQIVQDEINSLKADGADYVIGLGHLGLDDESAPYKSTDLIKDVEGLDIFVDGHSHHNLPNGSTVQDKTGEDVVVVQTGDYAKEIGKVVIKKDGTIEASLINEKREDEETTNLINQMKSDIKPLLDRVVGKTDVVLDGSRDPGVRTKETNLANLVTDGLKYVSGADVALTNGGGIRTSVDVGDITYGELNAVLPFGNVVTTIEVTGEQIVQALEHGTASVPNASGAFPQVSGITYEIHAYLEENRVKNVEINGQPVQLDKKYVLATNDFMAVGGDGYEMFKTAKKLGEFGAMDEALISYIEQLPNSTVGEEYAAEQGRINILLEEGQVPVIPLPDPEEGGPTAPNPGEGEGEGEDGTNPDPGPGEGEGEDGTNPDPGPGEGEDEGGTNPDPGPGEGEGEGEDEDENEDGTNPDQGEDQENEEDDESPQTGDENSIMAPVAIALVSMAILGAIVINRKKIVE